MVHAGDKKKVRVPYVRDKMQKLWEKFPLRRKIFTAHDVYRDLEAERADEFSDVLKVDGEDSRGSGTSLGNNSVHMLSLQDIIIEEQRRMKDRKTRALNADTTANEQHDPDAENDENITRKFQVQFKDVNGESVPDKIFAIKIFDVFFDDRVCSLVYM